MSNIAGKAYAMNVITPTGWSGVVNRAIFLAARTVLRARLTGLRTLSLIHYARWVVVGPKQWPHLGHGQPEEDVRYPYELFFSNFNGSWDQYIDSFSMSIASGLDLLWAVNVNYPKSIPIEAFHRYITANQIQTDHYYNAYPLASANDVKSAKRVMTGLRDLADATAEAEPDEFLAAYNALLVRLQTDLGRMEETPIVSLADEAIEEQQRIQELAP